MTPRVFVDSNVLLYLLSEDATKADIAEALLIRGPTVSVQMLSKVTNVCCRKFKMSWADIHTLIETVKLYCNIQSIEVHTHQTAMAVAQRYQLPFYDAQIVTAALPADCETLMTEDLQDGLQIQQLRVQNPFIRQSDTSP